ncbi:fimbrial protein [Bordetella petrii]|uniref:fimbrial protein n=1 Tax=Bordetella petrii TaxID=94624 RepID=UPI001E295733|nr:fimbrial protein [Bordetella petrii]MCD0502869.1 fimbrial protein [Bordetella petrii]
MKQAVSCLALAAAGVLGSMDAPLAAMVGPRSGSCYRNTGGHAPSGTYYEAYSSGSFQIAVSAFANEYAVPADPSPGQVLFSTTETYLPALSGPQEGRAAPVYDCPAGTIEHFNGNGPLVDAINKVYATSVPGIGYRVYYYVDDETEVAAPVSYVNDYLRGVLVFPFNGSYGGSSVRTRIDFVATSTTVSPGTILAATTYGESSISGASVPSGLGGLYKVRLAHDINIKAATCAISNPAALNVTLPRVPAYLVGEHENTGVFMTNITVTCSNPSVLSPTVRVTAASTVSGYAATLANQETGPTAARGVGIKMWLHDAAQGEVRPVSFGETENGLGSPQESLPARVWSFRFGGSYMQVGPTVTGGRVKATATITFTYI